jgi:hypothetical protein
LQWIIVFGRIVRMKSDECPFNALKIASYINTTIRIPKSRHTIKTYNRSSRIRASWMSSGTRSKDSCFDFPFDFGARLTEVTRELSGARTNEVSAMKDGSF